MVMPDMHAVSPLPQRSLLTAQEVAELLGVSRTTFWRMRQRHFPSALFCGGHLLRWDRSTIERWIADCRRPR